ncbi:MAG: hypothetical protein WC966_05310, partial [Bradymonadales bacterium]
MAKIPELVRFHYARQAPSPRNWYGQDDFDGCELFWQSPDERIARYIIFRMSENIEPDRVQELLDGYFDDIADRIDIFKPITSIVDDEIHDRNRYLVLARLENEDTIWIRDVESRRFDPKKKDSQGAETTYWSNPYGGTPKIKDPCRLEYANVRVSMFCGFSWDYPSAYPDFVGYDLIVSRAPISPHTGEDEDIEAFKSVLRGEMGALYQIDRFVNAIVDNITLPNRFWYYALLLRIPEQGRVQIPMRYHNTEFPNGASFQYLSPSSGWGVGRDLMTASFAKWMMEKKQEVTAPPMKDELSHTVLRPVSRAIFNEAGQQASFPFFRHAPDLSVSSYIANPSMVGIQFTAKVEKTLYIIALRAKTEPNDEQTALLLSKAAKEKVFYTEAVDGFCFMPRGEFLTLIDADCHDKPYYLIVTYNETTEQFSCLSEHVKDKTIDFLPNISDAVFWAGTVGMLTNHKVHVTNAVRFQKQERLSVEFGAVDESHVEAMEVYLFHREMDWENDADALRTEFYALQDGEESKIGKRYVFGGAPPGFVDDISETDSDVYCSACYLDKHNNRFFVPLFNRGNVIEKSWPRLSWVVETPAAEDFDVPLISEEVSEAKFSWDDDDEDDFAPTTRRSSVSSQRVELESSELETKSEKPRFSWDDDDEDDFAPTTRRSSVSSRRVEIESSELEAKSEKRKFSWDDDDEDDFAPTTRRSSVSSRRVEIESSDLEAESEKRKFSWDDDEDDFAPTTRRSSVSSRR